MLSHLESRLADVLGSRLAAPFGGRVFVLPGPDETDEPALLVGVQRAEVLPSGFDSTRPEIVPGADDPRRVVRLRCSIRIEARESGDAGRAERLAALDAVLYELDSPDLRDASALAGGDDDDPGFVLSSQLPQAVVVENDDVNDDRPAAVLVEAEGWFWPPNAPGITGVPITSARVRAAVLPVALEPWPLDLRTGDEPLSLSLRFGAVGTMDLGGDEPATLPFGALAVRVVDAGGRPGAGTLTGGVAGPLASRILEVESGELSFDYGPPDEPARDRLVVSIAQPDTGDGVVIGAELARFLLEVAP